jgi:hypothetical protein
MLKKGNFAYLLPQALATVADGYGGAVVRNNNVGVEPFMHTSHRLASHGSFERPACSLVEKQNDAAMPVVPLGSKILEPMHDQGR